MSFQTKKIIFFIFLALIAFSSYFIFFNDKKTIQNYPARGKDIIAFGDSLVEGVGASSSAKNFVSLLSQKISYPVVNLGISGNTTENGLQRINELDNYDPKIVLLLLGGNDFLKKVPREKTFANLGSIIENIHKRGAVVLLLGVRGGLLTDKFESDFEKLRNEYNTAYVPNVLEGIIGNSKYMSDAVHPNDKGYEKIAEKVYPILSSLLEN